MTNFERIKAMSIDEMAMCFATNKKPDLPHSPCYVCDYDEGFICNNFAGCTEDYKAQVYKKWLESEVQEE